MVGAAMVHLPRLAFCNDGPSLRPGMAGLLCQQGTPEQSVSFSRGGVVILTSPEDANSSRPGAAKSWS